MASTMAAGSLMRPAPVSPQAKKPPSGPTKCAPLARSVSTLRRVASAVHMPVFIAGARSRGAFAASRVVESISSARPTASLARMLAVAGATTHRSASLAREMCATSQVSGRAKVSVTTGWLARVSKVSGVTNSVAFFVMTTRTWAPSLRSRDTTSTAL